MTNTAMGNELQVGQVIKFNNRIYEILDIAPPVEWARMTEVRATNGDIVTFDVFTDSEYELRTKSGRPVSNKATKMVFKLTVSMTPEQAKLYCKYNGTDPGELREDIGRTILSGIQCSEALNEERGNATITIT